MSPEEANVEPVSPLVHLPEENLTLDAFVPEVRDGSSVRPLADVLQAKIFIVDDEPANVMLLECILEEAGYQVVRSTTSSLEAYEICRQDPPDLLLLDLMMPKLSGYDLLVQLRDTWGPENPVAVLALTADASRDACHRALSCGANDFIQKPFDRLEALLRVRGLLESRLLHNKLRLTNLRLEERVEKRTQELRQSNNQLKVAQIEALEKLAQAAEFRDDNTGDHTKRVGVLSALLAEELGLSAAQVELVRRAAPLHDVGKIAVPDAILLKPGKLSPEEFSVMKTHASIGAQLLSNSGSPLMQCAEVIACAHHERWDGSGYPHQLEGAAIPLEGRIVAVVDVFDALTHERPYKRAWPLQDAVGEISRHADHLFDPQIVQAFLRLPLESLV